MMPLPRDIGSDAGPAILGCCDRRLLVQQLAIRPGGARWSSSLPVIGRQLTDLLAATGLISVRTTIERCAHSGRAALLGVRIVSGNGFDRIGATCELVIVPQDPPPSCTFALLPTSEPTDSPVMYDVDVLVRQWGAGMHAPVLAAPPAPVPGWQDLTPREVEVVTRLVRGDRVPAIARVMVLSQSTVRSHLSSAAAKLGVHDQQGVLNLFRSDVPSEIH